MPILVTCTIFISITYLNGLLRVAGNFKFLEEDDEFGPAVRELALRTGLNWRTVKKALEIIRDARRFLDGGWFWRRLS